MLLERDDEVAVLVKAVRETSAGPGAVLLVEGAAGAGRTALLRHLGTIGHRAGVRVLRAGGVHAEQGFPLGVIRQLVMPLVVGPHALTNGVAAESPVSPMVRTLLAPLVNSSPSDAPAEPNPTVLGNVLQGLHLLFTALGERQPVLLLVDDLHRADEPSLRALAYLAQRRSGMRILIAVVPPHDQSPLLAEIAAVADYRVRAVPLSPEGVRRLVCDRFGGCDKEFVAACYDASGGSPRDLRELLNRAHSEHLLGRAADAPRIREFGAALHVAGVAVD